MEYVYVNKDTGVVDEVTDRAFIAITSDEALGRQDRNDNLFFNAPDDPRFDTVPLIEAITQEEDYVPAPKVAGFLETQEDVVLPARSVWYVRAMVQRGIEALENSIKECAEAAKDESLPPWAVRSLEGAASYNEQMLREVRESIPTSFQ